MHKPDIRPLVYTRLFPNPKPTDPTTFYAHVLGNLVQEVRLETVRFYGPIDCLEAQYPGLDYSNPAHRLRLSSFQWHRRLFRIFEELRLTDSEIRQLCNWEGTLHAREEYERIHKVKIRDTTWDGIEPFVSKPSLVITAPVDTGGHADFEQMSGDDKEAEEQDEEQDEEMEDSESEEVEIMEEEEEHVSEDELQQSVGLDLNQRLIAATEARARGEDVVLDAAWEQWLKEAAERDDYPHFSLMPRPGTAQQPGVGLTHWIQMMPEIYRSESGLSSQLNTRDDISTASTTRARAMLLASMHSLTLLAADSSQVSRSP